MEHKLPEGPGVYIFKDSDCLPLYIGKALNIKKRVRDHFLLKSPDYKERNLIEETKEVEAIPVDSEIESLILEANFNRFITPNSRTIKIIFM